MFTEGVVFVVGLLVCGACVCVLGAAVGTAGVFEAVGSPATGVSCASETSGVAAASSVGKTTSEMLSEPVTGGIGFVCPMVGGLSLPNMGIQYFEVENPTPHKTATTMAAKIVFLPGVDLGRVSESGSCGLGAFGGFSFGGFGSF